MQMNQKKRLVYGSIVFIWIIVPIWEANYIAFSTGIQQGVCMWNPTYMTEVALKTTGILNSVISYQLPLLLMVFCYARVVYALRTKVTLQLCGSDSSARDDSSFISKLDSTSLLQNALNYLHQYTCSSVCNGQLSSQWEKWIFAVVLDPYKRRRFSVNYSPICSNFGLQIYMGNATGIGNPTWHF